MGTIGMVAHCESSSLEVEEVLLGVVLEAAEEEGDFAAGVTLVIEAEEVDMDRHHEDQIIESKLQVCVVVLFAVYK